MDMVFPSFLTQRRSIPFTEYAEVLYTHTTGIGIDPHTDMHFYPLLDNEQNTLPRNILEHPLSLQCKMRSLKRK